MSSPLLLRNVRLVGSPGSSPVDLLIKDGIVGRATDSAGSVEVVDLEGRFVLHGLWDHHVHFDQWSLARRRIDLTGTTSAAEVIALVAERSAGEPLDDPMITGYGFRDGTWPEPPSRAALDRVAPATPVVLASNDLHCCWLNSAGFRRLGIPPTEDGLVREEAAFGVLRAIRDLVGERSDDFAAEAARAAAARGVVGIVELEFQPNHRIWSRRVAAGSRWLRVECGVYRPQFEEVRRLGLPTGTELPDSSGLLTMGPLKIILDGSLNTRTAACWEAYPEPGDPDHEHGVLQYDTAALAKLIMDAGRAGIECAVHAIGDRANTVALDAFAAAGRPGRIEHAQLIKDEDLPRFAELGVIASVQPDHALADREVADRYWAGRIERAYPYASLLAAGATLRLGSDAPVSPLDPWVTIAAAVSRTAEDREPWHPEQELEISAALAASTRGRAEVRPGDPADLVITELDPLTASAAELRTMPVHATMINGEWTHRSDASAE